MIEGIELQAEVFRVVRANSEKSPKEIYRIIIAHLPDVDPERIKSALKELSKE